MIRITVIRIKYNKSEQSELSFRTKFSEGQELQIGIEYSIFSESKEKSMEQPTQEITEGGFMPSTKLDILKNMTGDFNIYNLSSITIEPALIELLARVNTFVPSRNMNVAKTLIDLKCYVRKLNLTLLLGTSLDTNSTFRIASTYNPPLHPWLSLYENVCELDIRHIVNSCTRKIDGIYSKNNIGYEQAQALKFLSSLQVRITKPDKGGLVIFDIIDYNNKMEVVLNNNAYSKSSLNEMNIAHSHSRGYFNDLFEAKIDLYVNNYINIPYPRTPVMFGIPKIHKDKLNPPMRPLINVLDVNVAVILFLSTGISDPSPLLKENSEQQHFDESSVGFIEEMAQCAGEWGSALAQEKLSVLLDHNIITVASGDEHSLAVSDRGLVFSWGAGNDGQLGHGSSEDVVTAPRLIKGLSDHLVSQVSCGSSHCIALAKDGQLFTWGLNSHGQLGLGKGLSSQVSPQVVKYLYGIPLSQIAAGGCHSFALSLSGAVFGWGQNTMGQLGLNDEKDRDVPCHVKSLRTQKIVYISCGEEHTAALTKNGGVFTFGAGSSGQLGHDSTNNEINPRKVQELMGSEVSQIACGRQHTLAFVPSTGAIYAFGCDKLGQLGIGRRSLFAAAPYPVKGLWTAYSRQPPSSIDVSRFYVVKCIFCGGDQSFAVCFRYENSIFPDDFRTINHARCPKLINSETVDLWRQKLTDGSDSCTASGIIKVLSSAACWNGSFLDEKNDEHFKTNPKIPGIDLDLVSSLFGKLTNAHYSNLLEKACESFGSFLIPQMSSSPPDVEAMRIYLILPECPLLQDSKYYMTLTIPLAMAIIRLDANPGKVLDKWWCRIDPKYFFKLVEIYKHTVVYLLTGRNNLPVPALFNTYITAALRLLEKLHLVNIKARHVEYDKFYIREISDLVDIQEDYLMWFVNNASSKTRSSIKQDSVLLSSYPFVFDAQAKTKMLQTDAELQMQVAVNGANIQNIFMLLTMEPLLARNPFLVLHVRRENLVSDALRELSIHGDLDLKKPLKVNFDGEEAVDAGGVTKEFFLLLLKELLDPIYGMFTYYTESNLLWFSDICFVEHNWFHLIGIICGLAIYNFTVVDLNFPLALYKKLLNVEPSLEDLKELSPSEGRSLQQLLDYTGDDFEETFCLNFSMYRESYGVCIQRQLIPRGDNITKCKDNYKDGFFYFRQEFVDAYVNYIFNLAISEWYSAFSSGFLKVCGGKVLELFQPSELKAMVVGSSNYNWEELETNAVYKGDYSAEHPTVKIFWEVFHEFPLFKKKKFLLFLTGSDRIPIYGMSSLQIIIQPMSASEQHLPVAHTCYNILDLPKYRTKELLELKLTQAIEHYEGFSLV
ncbi:probable E3 ubiquitin-protein ligase HERC3 [Protopterus annectens]|uniref:probable E3 ubiquitin-protein ligase HERC3 n=1 Tax=Protopterus annectens TaxID=7888 RepID=UPI001CFAB1FB|nr:probable E3 ubiquitin-protein ligase HERC3 [Protopterus annectens]